MACVDSNARCCQVSGTTETRLNSPSSDSYSALPGLKLAYQLDWHRCLVPARPT